MTERPQSPALPVHPDLVTDDIRREAERLLARMHPDREAPTLGRLFPRMPGEPMPLDEWIAETDPWDDEGPRRTR